ncbi:MAG: EcsC family protein [Dysgonomonas sp.]|nr:EcsC family protein [Dysgonomonas sp.]
MKTNNNGLVVKVFDWAYSKAISGFGGVESAYKLGDEFLKKKGTLDQQVNSLIKWQVSKAATSGFLTGIGGFAILPFSLPANIASVIYIQIRMISAIAYMGGHDLQSDQVKTMVMASMIGNGAKEFLKDIGINAGEKVVNKMMMKSSSKIVTSINEKLGTKFFTKTSSKSLGKLVPLVGGIVGGAFDAASTRIVGKVAKKIFIDDSNNDTEAEIEEIVTIQVQ